MPFFALLIHVTGAPGWAQWATPTIDGFIANGEYGTNNQLNNAGGTGQTWYMTWDVSNLYAGIVNANLAQGAVIYIKARTPKDEVHEILQAYTFRDAVSSFFIRLEQSVSPRSRGAALNIIATWCLTIA